ncbi:phytanoyl-CoA hydroxylase-interacting protein-like isoform X1 [Mytilus edulis]|uniref:phytanoyl-CoA hydroxylase-interacting protein-like isoform X1 n=1 Tax=Mytilus edulis TaxID=6550 RepID=UPI0039EDF590
MADKNSSTFLFHAQLCGSRRFDLIIKWPTHLTVDVLYMLIVDKSSGRSVTIFLNPSERKFCSSLEFSPETSKYSICIYGLTVKETEYGRFYQLCSHSKRKLEGLKVADTDISDITMSFEMKKTRVVEMPMQHNIKKPMNVTVLRCPPATYSIVQSDSNSSDGFTHVIFLKQPNQTFVFILNSFKLTFLLPPTLKSGTWTEIQMLRLSQQNCSTNKHMIAVTVQHSHVISFKTYLSIDDYKQLYVLALEYLFSKNKNAHQCKPIEFFYRNKSEQYYKDILKSASGEMIPYIKDNNGDQGSIINGAINGLFYSTLLSSSSKPPPISFYGPVRLHLKANVMFTENCNIYFSDFYCHYQQHYVTIVLTRKGSQEDVFCNQFLLQMDKYNNPFMQITRNISGLNVVTATMAVVVEVFYTESVNVRSLLQWGHGYISKTVLMGRGRSKPEGIPKNENCDKCNLSYKK